MDAAPVTWTKLGDEFPAAARELTSDEFRTHVEALCWSSWRLLDLRVPKADVRRFAEAPDTDAAVAGLVAKGWWGDEGEAWDIGLHFPEWQQDRAQVEKRRAYLAEAQKRSRAHRAGDHSTCLPGKCPYANRVSTVDSADDPGRGGTGPPDPPAPLLSQTPSQKQNRRGTTPRTPRGHPPSSDDRAIDSRSKLRAGAEGDGNSNRSDAAPVKEGSATNSQNRGVRHGSETVADDVPGFSLNDADRATAGTTRASTRHARKPAA
jgi:hypothetical protein